MIQIMVDFSYPLSIRTTLLLLSNVLGTTHLFIINEVMFQMVKSTSQACSNERNPVHKDKDFLKNEIKETLNSSKILAIL